MRAFIIRCLVAAAALFFTVYLYATGYWGWGIFFTLITALIVLTFFRNENIILALNQMRVGNHEKAAKYVNRIDPTFLPKRQHAYVLYLTAMLNAQDMGFAKSEALLRKALSLGLKQDQDNAVAKMHLGSICAQTNRKQEAQTLLAEAKKLDKNGMLKEQLNMMNKQLTMVASKNQMRMAMMTKGRRKTPRAK